MEQTECSEFQKPEYYPEKKNKTRRKFEIKNEINIPQKRDLKGPG